MAGLLDFLLPDGDNNPFPGLLGQFEGVRDETAAPGGMPTMAPQFLPQIPPLPGEQDGGVMGGIGPWLRGNSNLLLALGAGLASGKDWGDGLGKAGMLALRARQADQQQLRQQQLALARLLMGRGAGRSTQTSPIPGVPGL